MSLNYEDVPSIQDVLDDSETNIAVTVIRASYNKDHSRAMLLDEFLLEEVEGLDVPVYGYSQPVIVEKTDAETCYSEEDFFEVTRNIKTVVARVKVLAEELRSSKKTVETFRGEIAALKEAIKKSKPWWKKFPWNLEVF